MIRHRQMVETLLSRAGVAIGGAHPWDITVKDERFFARVLREKNLGLGEAYMDGWWDCRRPDEFICRVQKAWPRLRAKYDEAFKRMWEYYLLSCAGAFRARSNQVWQIVLTKDGTDQPRCRF